MAKLNYFNGGLSLKASEYLIKENEAVIAINTNVDSGNLEPLNQDVNTGTPIGSKFTLFKNSWYSDSNATCFTSYNDYLLMDNTIGTKWPKYYNQSLGLGPLGMFTPEYPPNVLLNPAPDTGGFDTAYVTPKVNYSISGTTPRSDYMIKYYIFLYSSFGSSPHFIPIDIYGPVVGDITFSLTVLSGTTLPPEYSEWGVYRFVKEENGSAAVYPIYKGTSLTATTDNFTASTSIIVNTGIFEDSLFRLPQDYLIVKTIDGLRVSKKVTYTPGLDYPLSAILFTAIPDEDEVVLYRYIKSYSGGRSGYKKCKRVVFTSPVNGSHWVIDDGTMENEFFDESENSNPEFSYVFTQYIEYSGWESPPSAPAKTTHTNVIVYFSGGTYTPGVTHRRLYRMGGNYSEYMLIATVPWNTGQYNDNTFSEPGAVLTSQLNAKAPLELTHLTELNSMIFGSVGNKLHFSEIAYFWAWSPYNYIQFADTITGIAKSPNGLLVFTLNETYIVTGTSPKTLSKFLINSQYGCVEHNTISYMDNSAIWLSLDGICVSDGGAITLITKDKLKSFNYAGPYTSIVHNGTYYLGYDSGTLCLCLSPFSLYIVDIVTTCFGIKDNELYYAKDGYLYKAFASSSKRSLTYKSPVYSDGGISILKNYNNIYTYSSGTLTLTVYIDGTQVLVQTLNQGFTDISVPQSNRLGYTIQFQVIGTGELHEIEYKVEGRQNGR